MDNIINTATRWAETYTLSIVAAIAILLIGKFAAKFLRNLLQKLLRKSNLDAAIVSFLGNLFYGLLLTLVDKAKSVINELLSNDDRVLKDPAPQIVVGSLGDSSVNIRVRPWVKKENYWGFCFDMTENVKKKFDEEGI